MPTGMYIRTEWHRHRCSHAAWNKGKKGLQIGWNKGLPKELQPLYGKVGNRKGKKNSLESNKKRSESMKLFFANGGRNGMQDKHQTLETRKKISKLEKGKLQPNASIALKTYYAERRARLGYSLSPDVINRIIVNNRKTMLKKWKNHSYREKQIAAIMQGLFKRPTSLEKQMIEIINKNNLPYKYTGDGSFLIGYKNPDFININGEKTCIEVANTFHHDESYEKKRTAHFAKWGWKCIVFRQNKLDASAVLSRLRGDY